MKRLILLVLVCVILICTAKTQSTQREEIVITLGKASYTPYQDEYEKMLYPTVRITTPSGTGSGVVIASWVVPARPSGGRQASGIQTQDAERKTQDVYILTAAHVVGNESKVTIELYPENIKIEGTVVITDTDKDLALLRCELCVLRPASETQDTQPKTPKLYVARLAPKDYTPYLFCPVWAVGCSLGLDPRPSFGHITAITTPFYSPLTKGE